MNRRSTLLAPVATVLTVVLVVALVTVTTSLLSDRRSAPRAQPPYGAVEPSHPGREPLRVNAAARTARGVTVTYGESGCPRTGVTHTVRENASSVLVRLEADVPPADQICTMLYHAVEVALELMAPLRDRTVVDGSTGTAVPVS